MAATSPLEKFPDVELAGVVMTARGFRVARSSVPTIRALTFVFGVWASTHLVQGQVPALADDNASGAGGRPPSPLSELFEKPISPTDPFSEINATTDSSKAGDEIVPAPPPEPVLPLEPAPVSPPPSGQVAPAVAEGEVPSPLAQPVGVQEVVEVDAPPSGELAAESDNKSQWAVNGGLRTYRSTNVTRISGPKQPATAFEISAGVNAVFPIVKLDPAVISFTPTFTIMAQRAYFGQYTISNKDWSKQDARILDYEFRLASLAAEFAAQDDWKVTFAVEYDELRNFYQGSKLYHAIVPSIGISKVFPIRKDLAVLLDTSLRYASSKTVTAYEVPGVFDDDGDNLQTSFNVSLMRPVGEDGKLLLMPTFGFGRTGYVKNEMTGRADYLLLAGISASYQLKTWLSLQAFANYSHKFANDKGEEKLGAAAKYDNWDIGVALSGNHAF